MEYIGFVPRMIFNVFESYCGNFMLRFLDRFFNCIELVTLV